MGEGSSIQLIELSLTGPSRSPARVAFRSGLNVVVGPSDTGKTFLFQCIDFMLGASSAPKEIPESRGYDRVHMKVRLQNGTYTLSRALRGGDFSVATHGPDGVTVTSTETLAAKHNPNSQRTVSALLLSGMDALEAIVRVNKSGKTRQLSFRDVAHLVLVDEQRIITETSPVHSGQFTTKTVESSVLRYLLTGIDDSGVAEAAVEATSKAKIEARAAVVDELRGQLRAALRAVGSPSIEAAQQDLHVAEGNAAELAAVLDQVRGDIAAVEGNRAEVARNVRSALLARNYNVGLVARLGLLQSQYEADVERLETVAEGADLLGQVPATDCPVCGSAPEHHSSEHLGPPLETVAAASRAEAARVRALMHDLTSTIARAELRLKGETAAHAGLSHDLQVLDAAIREDLRPRVNDSMRRWIVAEQRKTEAAKVLDLWTRDSQLAAMVESAPGAGDGRTSTTAAAQLRADDFERICAEAESLLREWRLLSTGRVVWSEGSEDLVIDGRPRASHGKGYRAITHAAFTLAVLAAAQELGAMHPGFVVIDSPLVAFKQAKPEDRLDPLVKDMFYRSVAKRYEDRQVIVIENEAPPDDITGVNVVAFTGRPPGRTGML
jgi:hypothetical protein